MPGSTRCYQLLISSFDLFRTGSYWAHVFFTTVFYNFITKLNKLISEIRNLTNKKMVCFLAETCRFLCKTAEQSFFHCKIVSSRNLFFSLLRKVLCFCLKIGCSRFYKVSTDRFFSKTIQ